ncbi:MAG: FtsX-like permease family protein, partial [Gemmatimonadetes bacterium]|nr:FtsX-like permease family protein [Gemmatimonadota bacterium]
LLTALAAAVIPALRVAAHAPAPALRTGGRGGGPSRSRRRATRWLVGAQLALAIVLVASGGLLTRTILALSQVDPGFATADRFTARIHLPAALTNDREARATYFEGLEEAIRSRPAIVVASLASTIPFGQETEFIATAIDGVTLDPNDLPVFPHHRVSPSYFQVSGIPLLRGRPFNTGDRLDGPLVAIVNEAFESQFLSGQSALGRVVRYPWRGAPAMEVVGVVGSVRHEDLSEPPQPTLWVPLAQMGMGALGQATVVVQGAAGRGAPLAAISDAVAEYDDRIAVSDLVPYEGLLSRSLTQQRLVMVLLLVFAGTALALGCVGVYGVAAFSVRQRFREFGVRLALGAPAERIRSGVIRDGLGLALPGAVVGLVLAIPAARALESVLYGVNAFDPLTLGAAPLILTTAAMLATYIPARRAMRVDPAVVLREE